MFLAPGASLFAEFDELPASFAWVLGGTFLFGLAIFPFMVAGVISFQCINPYSAEKWTRPSHYDNP